MVGEGGQLWRSGRGAIGGCHCSVLWLGASVTTNFGGVDVVSNGIQKKHPEKLPSASCRRVLYIDNTKLVLLSGVYAGIIF